MGLKDASTDIDRQFPENIEKMKAQGLSEREIAESFGLSVSQYRVALAIAKNTHNKKGQS